MKNQVLHFWFEEIDPSLWWKADPVFDQQIRARFLTCLQQAAQGELFGWRQDAKGRLAEIIVLDQFSRNVYRNAIVGRDSTAEEIEFLKQPGSRF